MIYIYIYIGVSPSKTYVHKSGAAHVVFLPSFVCCYFDDVLTLIPLLINKWRLRLYEE